MSAGSRQRRKRSVSFQRKSARQKPKPIGQVPTSCWSQLTLTRTFRHSHEQIPRASQHHAARACAIRKRKTAHFKHCAHTPKLKPDGVLTPSSPSRRALTTVVTGRSAPARSSLRTTGQEEGLLTDICRDQLDNTNVVIRSSLPTRSSEKQGAASSLGIKTKELRGKAQ